MVIRSEFIYIVSDGKNFQQLGKGPYLSLALG